MKQLSIRDKQPEERPYERCIAYGPQSLTDVELLAILLRTGSKDNDVMALSTTLLSGVNKADGLSFLLHSTYQELLQIKGIGSVKAVQLLAMGELVKRIWRGEISNKPRFTDSSACAAYFTQEMKHLEREEMRLVFLDANYKMTGDMPISIGTHNSSLVGVREILIESLRRRAACLIVIHNHPSGIAAPSEADETSTRHIKLGCDAVGIRLLDHIIIAGTGYYSFKENYNILR